MAKPKTVPLKVTARMIDGRLNSADGIVMFDSILYHAWFAKHHPDALETGMWMTHGSGYIGLPLRQLPGNRWAASRGIYEEVQQNIEYWHKRPDFFASDKIEYLDMDKGLISDSVGKHRAYRTQNVIRIIKDGIIDFFCVGHMHDILDLLRHIPAVGKKPSMGWGLIDEWSVKEIDNDYSLSHPDYGLMRPLPVDDPAGSDIDISKYPKMMYAVKPPYHKKENQRLCYVPV